MNVFVEINLLFWFFIFGNWIERLFFISLFYLCDLVYFVLTHWSMERVECRFFTLISLRSWKGNLSLHSKKENGFHCLLMSPCENWTPCYIFCSMFLNSFNLSFESLLLFLVLWLLIQFQIFFLLNFVISLWVLQFVAYKFAYKIYFF